jgi:hypothetical protein
MVEVLFRAINREHFFDKRFAANDFGPFGYPAFITIMRVNLPDPTGISITGRTYEDLGMEVAEMKGLKITLGPLGHDFSLDENMGLPNFRTKGGVQIFRTYPNFFMKFNTFLVWQENWNL